MDSIAAMNHRRSSSPPVNGVRLAVLSGVVAITLAGISQPAFADALDHDFDLTAALLGPGPEPVKRKDICVILVTSDNKLSCHFSLTPVGWQLAALAQNRVYKIPEGDGFHLSTARRMKEMGADRFRPVWVINKIGSSIITIDWMHDHEQSCDPDGDILAVLEDLDSQFNLHFADVVKESQCQTNFPSSFNKIRFFSDVSPSLESTREHC